MVISIVVPLIGNLCFSLFIGRVRAILTSPLALRRTNITAGVLLIIVGLVIPFT
jgi:threonine/homoserine/homoserine lactone efflux protein